MSPALPRQSRTINHTDRQAVTTPLQSGAEKKKTTFTLLWLKSAAQVLCERRAPSAAKGDKFKQNVAFPKDMRHYVQSLVTLIANSKNTLLKVNIRVAANNFIFINRNLKKIYILLPKDGFCFYDTKISARGEITSQAGASAPGKTQTRSLFCIYVCVYKGVLLHTTNRSDQGFNVHAYSL